MRAIPQFWTKYTRRPRHGAKLLSREAMSSPSRGKNPVRRVAARCTGTDVAVGDHDPARLCKRHAAMSRKRSANAA